MLNSNFLKGGYAKGNEPRVIDYNEMISQKLENLRKKAETGELQNEFVSGLDAQNVENLIGGEGRIFGDNSLETFATDVSAMEGPEITLDEIKDQAEAIVKEADDQARQMLMDARKEVAEIQENARKEGFNAGYMEGNSQGYTEGLQKAEAQYAAQLQAVEEERTQLATEKKQLEDEFEPKIINTILDVIGRVTGIVYENNRDILIHLINQALQGVEASQDYTIRVSREDYEFVVSRQSKLYCASVKDVNIEVIEDKELTAGKCIIETDGGIFDCSLDVQMEQLVRDIRLLAGL